MELFNGLEAKMDYEKQSFEIKYGDAALSLSVASGNRLRVSVVFPAYGSFSKKMAYCPPSQQKR